MTSSPKAKPDSDKRLMPPTRNRCVATATSKRVAGDRSHRDCGRFPSRSGCSVRRRSPDFSSPASVRWALQFRRHPKTHRLRQFPGSAAPRSPLAAFPTYREHRMCRHPSDRLSTSRQAGLDPPVSIATRFRHRSSDPANPTHPGSHGHGLIDEIPNHSVLLWSEICIRIKTARNGDDVPGTIVANQIDRRRTDKSSASIVMTHRFDRTEGRTHRDLIDRRRRGLRRLPCRRAVSTVRGVGVLP